MVYLFIGQDASGKDAQLKAIRKEFLDKGTEQFNLDIIYAKDLSLKDLQERLFYLPVRNPKRIVIIKEAQNLKPELREFILGFVKAKPKQTILILDVDRFDKHDEFIAGICKYAKTVRFKEVSVEDAFTLNRQIALRKPDLALKILNQLLKNGERPERILGGLRYAWERDSASPLEMKRRLRLLLNCDIDIKTGKLKPNFALEKLVINLCGPIKALG